MSLIHSLNKHDSCAQYTAGIVPAVKNVVMNFYHGPWELLY